MRSRPRSPASPSPALKIDFAKNVDPTGMRTMHSEARWVQELYPVDEMLSRKLNLPLEKIALNEIDPPANGSTIASMLSTLAGKEFLTRDFTVTSRMQPYNGVMPRNTNRCRWRPAGCGWKRQASRDSGPAHQDRSRRVLGPLPEQDAAAGLQIRDDRRRTANCAPNSSRPSIPSRSTFT